jgi:hypothetical protein
MGPQLTDGPSRTNRLNGQQDHVMITLSTQGEQPRQAPVPTPDLPTHQDYTTTLGNGKATSGLPLAVSSNTAITNETTTT